MKKSNRQDADALHKVSRRKITAKQLKRINTMRRKRRAEDREARKKNKNHVPTRRQGRELNRLTTAQKEFIAVEYMKDWDPQATAKRTGFKPGTVYNLHHKDTEFSQIMARLTQELTAKSKVMTADEVLYELSLIGKANIADHIRLTPYGSLEFRPATREQWAAVQEIVGRTVRGAPRVRLHSKSDALKMLGTYHKLFSADGLPPGADGGRMNPPTLNITFIDSKPTEESKKS